MTDPGRESPTDQDRKLARKYVELAKAHVSGIPMSPMIFESETASEKVLHLFKNAKDMVRVTSYNEGIFYENMQVENEKQQLTIENSVPNSVPDEEIVDAFGIDVDNVSLCITAIGGSNLRNGYLDTVFEATFARGAAEYGLKHFYHRKTRPLFLVAGTAAGGVMKSSGEARVRSGNSNLVVAIGASERVFRPGGEVQRESVLSNLDYDTVNLNASHILYTQNDETIHPNQPWLAMSDRLVSMTDYFLSKKKQQLIILAGGGPSTIYELKQLLPLELPMVVFKGSGRAADALLAIKNGTEDLLPAEEAAYALELRAQFGADVEKYLEHVEEFDFLASEDIYKNIETFKQILQNHSH